MKQRLVFLSAALALLAVIHITMPQRHTERIAIEPTTLAIATDLHYIAPELTDGGAYFTRIVENGDGKAMRYCEEITDAFAARIIEQKPDALLLDVNTPDAPGVLTDATFQWAQRQLEAARHAGVHVLAVSHQNLLSHNSLFSDGYVIGNGERLLRLYEQSGVLCNLSGHLHIQHTAKSGAGLPEIVTSSLITAPFQYGVLTLDASAAAYGTDRLTFSHMDESTRFFADVSLRKAAEELTAADETLCAFFAGVNAAYFSGRTDAILWDDALYAAIREQSAFLGLYLQSIRDDGDQDHTKQAWRITD